MPERVQIQAEPTLDGVRSHALPNYAVPLEAAQDFEQERPGLPLTHYVWLLKRHVWKMVAFVAACVLLTFIISARLPKIYEASATINIDPQAPAGVVGQDTSGPYSGIDPDILFTTQTRLIQSDTVLRPVAEQFFSIGGSEANSDPAHVSTVVIHKNLQVVRPTNTYLLQISYRATNPQLAANVANAIANSYLAQVYQLHTRSSADLASFMGQQLDQLKARMEKSNEALLKFEKDMDVINPDQKTDILSSRLQQLNSEYTNAQTDRVTKEAAWNAVKSGSLEAAELSSQSDSLGKLANTLDDARQRFALVKSTYGVHHPEYRKAQTNLNEAQQQFNDALKVVSDKVEQEYKVAVDREAMLKQAVTDVKAEWDQINEGSFQYQQLKQSADADKALYNELITKINEAGINAGFQSNNIRLADAARPSNRPVSPRTRLNVMMAFLLSMILAIGAVVLLDSLDTTLRDPVSARRYLGADVIGSLPLDRVSSNRVSTAEADDASSESLAAAMNASGNGKAYNGYYRSISPFEEAIRTIRNTILLSDFEKRLRSIAITSAEPGEGKTTLAAHLAIANAARGKTTLLVDGDLRRPSVHARFGLDPKVGLSNVLNGEMNWTSVVLPVEGHPDLSILPSGPGSHRAADLIGPHLAELLNEFAKKYDLVILDSPPLLGFAECLQMADAADGVLVVSKAGKTKRKAVATVVSTLTRIRANLLGVVLNQVTQETSEDAYTYYGYRRYEQYSERE